MTDSSNVTRTISLLEMARRVKQLQLRAALLPNADILNTISILDANRIFDAPNAAVPILSERVSSYRVELGENALKLIAKDKSWHVSMFLIQSNLFSKQLYSVNRGFKTSRNRFNRVLSRHIPLDLIGMHRL